MVAVDAADYLVRGVAQEPLGHVLNGAHHVIVLRLSHASRSGTTGRWRRHCSAAFLTGYEPEARQVYDLKVEVVVRLHLHVEEAGREALSRGGQLLHVLGYLELQQLLVGAPGRLWLLDENLPVRQVGVADEAILDRAASGCAVSCETAGEAEERLDEGRLAHSLLTAHQQPRHLHTGLHIAVQPAPPLLVDQSVSLR